MIFKDISRATTIMLHKNLRKNISYLDWALWRISSKKENIKPSKIKKILVVLINQEKGNAGGDFATLGVLNCFKKNFPKKKIFLLSDKKTLNNLGSIKGIEIILSDNFNLKELRKKNIDVVIFMNPGKFSPKNFNFIPIRVGFTARGIKGYFRRLNLKGYTLKIFNRLDEHMIDLRFKMFEGLGFKFKHKKLFLDVSEAEKKKANSFIKENKLKKFIIIHPGGKYVAESYKQGKWPPHLWNIERYSEVANYFVNKGFQIIITGSKDESSIAEEIRKNNPKIINSCGKLALKEIGFLLTKTSCLVSTDTSIVHIAYQVDVPIVELMGPSIPEIAGAWPLNSPNHIILIDKGPCYKSMRKLPYKDNFNCLKNIKTEEVISAVNSLISKPR